MNHKCLVCGYPKLEETPRTQSGGGSCEICPSCGFQFGVSDDDRGFTYAQWREKWRAGWDEMSRANNSRPPVGTQHDNWKKLGKDTDEDFPASPRGQPIVARDRRPFFFPSTIAACRIITEGK